MRYVNRIKNLVDLTATYSRYNLKIIFANKFIYFLIAAFIFYLLITLIFFFSSDSDPSVAQVFGILVLPGILLVFYPMAFGIQNDVDSRMIEILFGIPNYRYKVWVGRMFLIWVLVFVILLALALLSSVILVSVPVFKVVYHLMFPIFFLGSICFLLSTLIRDGTGTAVVMVIIGVGLMFLSDFVENSKWDLFINPFITPENEAVFAKTVMTNRIYLAVGTVIALLYGLLNLQKREKFI